MSAARERDVERICQEALERPRGERETFLRDACAGDEDLRRAVERLLAHEPAASGFLSTPALAVAADLATRPALRAGQRIGSYTILSSLGSGGMGEVYRARDATLGRDVAIKVLPPIFTGDRERLARFEREARMLAALNHPNIATIHGVERVESAAGSGQIDSYALVLELVEGRTLEEHIGDGSLKGHALSDALTIATQIAEALEAAHEKGIIHRDLKPANVKLRPDGVVKVLDFGLARPVFPDTPGLDVSHSPTEIESRTQEGLLVGTAAYMSPEQASGRTADRRADIWAFGVVLYEMVTGKRPFAGDSIAELFAAILTKDPVLDAVPAHLRPIVEKCLRKDLRKRWQSIGDVRLALEEGGAIQPSANTHATTARARWTVAAAALLIVALVGLATVYFRESPSERQTARFEIPIPGGDAPDVNFALSPDGKTLAITAVQNGRRNLYVRPIDSLDVRLIPDTDGANYPFWSPDSTTIAFSAGSALKKVSAAGGPVFTLTGRLGTGALGGAWSSAGTILFSSERSLQRISEAGGAATPVLTWDSAGPSNPQFLPDGRTFIFTLADARAASEDEGIYIGSLEGTPPIRVLPGRTKAEYAPPLSGEGPGHLVFRQDGVLMAQPFDPDRVSLTGAAIRATVDTVISMNGYGPTVLFSTSNTGALAYQPNAREQLVWVDRTGTIRERVGPPGEYRNFRLSPDGGSVAMDVTIFGTGPSPGDVARLDLKRGVFTRLTVDGEADLIPVWSPDGTQIAFSSRRLGTFKPFVTTGPNQERLLVDVGTTGGWPVDWSADGDLILWEGSGLWLLPARGNGKPVQFLPAQFRPQHAQFSPIHQWIAYSSNESGRAEIYVQAFPAGRRYTVTGSGGVAPAWRRDGRELFYIASDGTLTAVPVTLGETSIEFGRPVSLFAARAGNFGRNYEVSANGQRFLIATPASPGGPAITVVLNWQQGLEH